MPATDRTPGSVTVVGAGLAGLRTVERLRERGFTGGIELFGGEEHPPYDRPPLSKQVLRGEADEVWLRPADGYPALRAGLRLGLPVLGLDADRRLIRTGEGTHPYEALVIATGAEPRRIPGLGGRVLRTLDDARSLRAELRPGAVLGIVGAGLIGCEVAAGARALGVEVHLVDAAPGPLARVVGERVGGLLADLHRGHGVELHMGTTAIRTAAGLSLSDGTGLAVDTVLEAVGSVPATGWLRGGGLDLGDGVRCDAAGRALSATGGIAAGVYAVGDVACWDGVRHEHWTSAGEQADRVAAAILGQEPPPAGPPFWWSDQYDLKLQGLGTLGPDLHLVAWGPKAKTIALYARDGRLTGAVGFSAPAAVVRLRADVAGGRPIGDVLERFTR
ncbi:NAD(P)/FAD-dependent oxidoreductase [Actinocorallia longicatena]|uniref:FAD-dependent oxidoreductase n=1 Tax=Actinocorallia longicatena TaxID=111803 RepID=A0ABP6QJ95_9ACTN